MDMRRSAGGESTKGDSCGGGGCCSVLGWGGVWGGVFNLAKAAREGQLAFFSGKGLGEVGGREESLYLELAMPMDHLLMCFLFSDSW